jgi:hypothetical protein
VQHYAPYFEEVFSAEAFIQFERYISGLIVSENKTVDGINRLFVFESRNQSSLNRLLTESPFSLEDLNQACLTLLSRLPGTQIKRNGVLSVDNTLLVHYGDHFDQIACLRACFKSCVNIRFRKKFDNLAISLITTTALMAVCRLCH